MFLRACKPRAGVLLCLLLVSLLAACAPPGRPDGKPGPANAHLLLAEVYASGFAVDGSDQFVRLHNPSGAAIDLAGWSVGDAKARATFPVGARVGPGQGIYIARDAAGFQKVMGAPPDYVWAPAGDGKPAPGMQGGAGLLLGKLKGTVILRDNAGAAVDALVYGESPGAPVQGWSGPAAPPPIPGEVIDRRRDEASWNTEHPGFYTLDTNTAADWRHGDTWVDQRVLRPGQTWFAYPTYNAARLTAYASPDNAYGAVSALVDKARQRIDVTLYDFTLVPMAEKLAAAARRGVKVRLLMEAGSLNRVSNQERYVAKVVEQAGGEVRWIVNDPSAGIYGRYVYNHAKYGVVDGKVSFVQSENMVRHGVPTDPTFGNRGWGVVVEDPGLSAYLTRVFEADWNPAFGDTIAYKPGTPLGPPPDDYKPETEELKGRYPHPFPLLTVNGPVPVTPVLAPEHALLDTKGVIGLIRSAKDRLLIEQQYVHLHWGPTTGSPVTSPDLFLEESFDAARRGVSVRILLSDAFLDPEEPKDNTNTVDYINDLARREGLDLQARVVRSDVAGIDKIHNKGIVVDDRRVLISSINWSYNSPANNREVGLIVDHPQIGALYADLFAYDWYNGAPADYPIITEVDATTGFVEIATFGPKPVDMSGWTLNTTAGEWALPARTVLYPGKPMVLARDAVAFKGKYGQLPTLVEMPGLNLRGDRDTVQLRRRDRDRLVDAVSWGEHQPGWKLAGPARSPVCRENPGKDTNTHLDWAPAAKGTPGLAGCGK